MIDALVQILGILSSNPALAATIGVPGLAGVGLVVKLLTLYQANKGAVQTLLTAIESYKKAPDAANNVIDAHVKEYLQTASTPIVNAVVAAGIKAL